MLAGIWGNARANKFSPLLVIIGLYQPLDGLGNHVLLSYWLKTSFPRQGIPF